MDNDKEWVCFSHKAKDVTASMLDVHDAIGVVDSIIPAAIALEQKVAALIVAMSDLRDTANGAVIAEHRFSRSVADAVDAVLDEKPSRRTGRVALMVAYVDAWKRKHPEERVSWQTLSRTFSDAYPGVRPFDNPESMRGQYNRVKRDEMDAMRPDLS